MSAATPQVAPRDLDRLETVDWGEQSFGSLVTSRSVPRRAMLRLVERGLVRSVGDVELCDDDGFVVDSGRTREGFVLTDAGREALQAHRAARWEAICGVCGEYREECDECGAGAAEKAVVLE